jgi:hypothetical protein
MPNFNTITGAIVGASVFALGVISRVEAQTCSIASTTRGPLSCAVTTSVLTTIRMPALVRVNVTPLGRSAVSAHAAPGVSVVQAAVEVSANRSYSLQIGSVPAATLEPQMGDHGRAIVAFSRAPVGRADRAGADPIRLILTIVAP